MQATEAKPEDNTEITEYEYNDQTSFTESAKSQHEEIITRAKRFNTGKIEANDLKLLKLKVKMQEQFGTALPEFAIRRSSAQISPDLMNLLQLTEDPEDDDQ